MYIHAHARLGHIPKQAQKHRKKKTPTTSLTAVNNEITLLAPLSCAPAREQKDARARSKIAPNGPRALARLADKQWKKKAFTRQLAAACCMLLHCAQYRSRGSAKNQRRVPSRAAAGSRPSSSVRSVSCREGHPHSSYLRGDPFCARSVYLRYFGHVFESSGNKCGCVLHTARGNSYVYRAGTWYGRSGVVASFEVLPVLGIVGFWQRIDMAFISLFHCEFSEGWSCLGKVRLADFAGMGWETEHCSIYWSRTMIWEVHFR